MEGKALTLAELAIETDTLLVGDPEYLISGVSEPEGAGPHEAIYIAESRYVKSLKDTKAGVVFITPQFIRPEGLNYLLSDNPAFAFQKFARLIAKMRHKPSGFTGIHPTAVVHPTARLGHGVQIGPNSVIECNVTIGDNTVIGPLVYIGPEVSIGQNGVVYPNATIHENTLLGDRVVIQSGVVLGGIGFHFRQDDQGRHQRFEHLGNVEIEDDVEIGANTTIDRARLKTTRISRGTKIDNQVQIGHNCKIGPDNIIVAQVGIAGSSETGRWVVLAGRVCINDHVKICDKATIAAASGVLSNIDTPGIYLGFPAIPLRKHQRLLVCFHNLDKIMADVQKMKRLLKIGQPPEKVAETPKG